MNALPVLKRELQAQARQAVTHWTRAGAVAAMLGGILLFALSNDFTPGAGAHLLTYLHAWTFFAIWIFVPTLTADCLSRERREGTLSLLFLTNLRPFDIVLAKATAHALRAFTFWLATLPALTLPFLIGGAGWQHALLSVLFNFMALCLALGAALVSSSLSKAWLRATAGALCLAVVFGAAFFLLNLGAVAVELNAVFSGRASGQWHVIFRSGAITEGIAFAVGGLLDLGGMNRVAGMQAAWLKTEIWMAVAALGFLWLCLWLAARNLARHWQQEPSSLFAQWLERKFTTPIIAVDLLQRWMRRTLERNPIGWLEQRTWTGRTMMWAWLAVVTSIYITVFSGLNFTPMVYEALQGSVAWSLALGVAFTAAGSFRRERETGVLELLLVSPTSSWRILSGRVRGLWGQFLPALVLLFGIWGFLFTFGDYGHSFARLVFYATMLLSLPVIGLYFSLKQRSFFSALLWTLAVGCVLPVLMQVVLAAFLPGSEVPISFSQQVLFFTPQGWGLPSPLRVLEYAAYIVRVGRTDPQLFSTSLILASVLQAINAANYGVRLHRKLESRGFEFDRGMA